MKTSYECEICGATSKTIEKIEKCEAQGETAKFQVYNKVRFRPDTRYTAISQQLEVGFIAKIRYRRWTHEPIYCVVYSGIKGRQRRSWVCEKDLFPF